MKIKIKKSISGKHNENSFSYIPNQEVEVAEALANDLIKAGYAEKVVTVSKSKSTNTKKSQSKK